ncbi:polyunsaturated fatty acid 5-lipoxygenase-like isoform X2 [Chiloscyllium plagiosum]|uniref:polyunsaturated fatty acid 5-lipoxygenase-like isoform X2 n=1 Tax=Chiloscyllium plagiosum TaxID=36176 RepID=UPI001CB7CC53|nr:polyunsaturated fatty acid 5-lipoxygenase-like isoform X2 [Chiloscyllium plagiosum]
MITYRVTVATGTTYYSGTNNYIYVTLIGEKGKSQRTSLDKWLQNNLERGSVDEYEVKSERDLGSIWWVQLEKVKFLVEDDWFCRYLTVCTPSGDILQFPCYRWMSEEDIIHVREGKAKRPCDDDKVPDLKSHRQKELQNRQTLYRWKLWKPGVTKCIEADTETDLHPDVKFDDDRRSDFKHSFHVAIGELFLKKFVNMFGDSWDSLESFQRIFWRVKSATGNFVVKHWKEDWFFGYQFKNGSNPCMIEKCREIPEKFPVTNEMVCQSLRGSTLEEEIKKGNIYIVDYKVLDGVPANVIKGVPQYIAAPICLLYQDPENRLMPIAIQLHQVPGCDNPIFLPTDPENVWLLAKIWVRSSEFQVHQIVYHLCGTHLLGETFCIATLRQLPAVHPIFKLLTPHTRYTLEINTRARSDLLGEDGVIARVVASGGIGQDVIAQKGMQLFTYQAMCLPDNLKERGTEGLKEYYYQEDGLQLWFAINKYVKGITELYYKTDQDVLQDTELQAWIKDLAQDGFQELPGIGILSALRTREEMCKFLTMVIFTCSAQHAAVNNGQYDWSCWVPNSPCTMRQPPPVRKDNILIENLMETLPDMSQSAVQMAFTWHLGRPLPNKILLGSFDEEYFTEETAKQIIAEFQKDLAQIEERILERNKGLLLSYEYLQPSNIENSISI